MSQGQWTTRGALGIAGFAAVMAVAGCGTSGSPAPAGSSGPGSSTATGTTTPTSTSSASQADPSDSAGQSLCDQIKPQLSDWDVQGPTLGGAALNITVHQWALGNGGLPMSARVLADKGMIDRITIKNCPDIRTRALQALNLQSFASGILG
ncbi:hypothetical protein [Nocardia alni]|uniref:hypothetical protein n=1 Tax=Nocardia alni TaxID=2815723 RepID=UPI0020B3F930|nr:hypothetical protein [Nocardia alni]